MEKLEGKVSFFGGPSDSGMQSGEGLAFYEHHEANLRPDLFIGRSTDPLEGVSKRLRNNSARYIALRISGEREDLKKSVWKVSNPKTGKFVIASLVDWGPHEKTGRVCDFSDAIGYDLHLFTDDIALIERII